MSCRRGRFAGDPAAPAVGRTRTRIARLNGLGDKGGSATFSNFSLEWVALTDAGRIVWGLGYAMTSLMVGLLAAVLGAMLGRRMLTAPWIGKGAAG